MDRSEPMAVTQRPAAYAELLVDSLDRYSQGFPPNQPTSSSDWQTRLKQIVLNGYFTRLGVTQIHFQWNLPTIIPGYNDALRVIVQNAPNPPTIITVTVAGGYYTPDGLAAAVQTALLSFPAGVTAGLTCQYNNLGTGALTIAATTAGWTFGFAPAGTAFVSANRKCLQTIGFFNFLGAAGSNLLVGSPIPCLATRFIDICSTTLTKFQRVKDTTTLDNPTISNVIARIYATAPNTIAQQLPNWTTAVTELPGNAIGSHPFTICIDYNNPKWIKWSPDEALSNFDLQLRDENGDLIPFGLGPYDGKCEYQLTILASES